MGREAIIQKFNNLKIWKRGDTRAPHKPLLILYAIGRLRSDRSQLVPYSKIDEDLGKLLQEFGPRQTTRGTEHPFWRLQNDDVWAVVDANQTTPNLGKNPSKRKLLDCEVSGGFHEAIVEQLQQDTRLASEIIQNLLNAHFPPSIHEDILQAVGIDFPLQIFQQPKRNISRRQGRDSNFRPNILKAYEYRCAVCSFDVKLGAVPIALEAAHIKWHTHRGPDVVANGLALCSLHHKLFDLGAFTLSKRLEILVSDDAHGSAGFEEWLMRFHGETISFPQRRSYYPEMEFIGWHVKEVFKGNHREL